MRSQITTHSFRTYDFSNRYLLLQTSQNRIPSNFLHPSLSLVERVAIYLDLTEAPIHRSYDPCFADDVLQALILDASPAISLLESIDFHAYWEGAAQIGT